MESVIIATNKAVRMTSANLELLFIAAQKVAWKEGYALEISQLIFLGVGVTLFFWKEHNVLSRSLPFQQRAGYTRYTALYPESVTNDW